MSAPARLDLASALQARLDAALSDPEVRLAGAGLDEPIALLAGAASLGIVPRGDALAIVRPAPAGARVRIAGAAEVWAAALAPLPAPGYHSFTALRKAGHLSAEGDALALARSLHLVERIFELLRGPPPPEAVSAAPREIGQIRGGYHRLAPARAAAATVYAESAGCGAPVLFLHTAGADSRQYQHLLSDVELAGRWRLHAFDLPMHGRSMPPPGWDGGRWVLTEAAYASWCVAFLEQVVEAPAVIVGCSMGAAMALVLAATRPELVRGVIALEAPLRAQGRRSPYLAHPAVDSASHNASYVRGLMSPAASLAARRAATWIYAQGGPGVYAGDLVFYEEFDGAAVAPRLGPECPVAFLTGAYDYSAPPEDARRLAALVPGSTVEIMPDLGHFPMIEDPDRFRTHFAPALARLAARQGWRHP